MTRGRKLNLAEETYVLEKTTDCLYHDHAKKLALYCCFWYNMVKKTNMVRKDQMIGGVLDAG